MLKLPNPFDFVQPDSTPDAEQIEPLPVFISDPSPEYLDALWLYPIVEVLKAY